MKILLALSSLLFGSMAYGEVIKCEFNFANDSFTLNQKEVESCQAQLKSIKDPIDYSFTLGSASFSGSTKYNSTLASNRSEVVNKAFKDLVANLKDTFPGGASKEGRKAWIVFVSSKTTEKVITNTVEKEKIITNTVEKEKLVTNTKTVDKFLYPTNGEVGFALGDYFVRFGSPAHYKSIQVSLGLKAPISDKWSFTYGLMGGIAAREAFKDVWNAYGKLGFSYSNTFAFDINGILGGLFLQNEPKNQKSIDGGGNIFTGLALGNFKVGLEGTITRNTSFLGLGLRGSF